MNTIYEVTWFDAWGNGPGYYQKGDDYTPMTMRDIGYVVEENDETLVLCSGMCTDDNRYRHLHIIPWDYIVNIEELVG